MLERDGGIQGSTPYELRTALQTMGPWPEFEQNLVAVCEHAKELIEGRKRMDALGGYQILGAVHGWVNAMGDEAISALFQEQIGWLFQPTQGYEIRIEEGLAFDNNSVHKVARRLVDWMDLDEAHLEVFIAMVWRLAEHKERTVRASGRELFAVVCNKLEGEALAVYKKRVLEDGMEKFYVRGHSDNMKFPPAMQLVRLVLEQGVSEELYFEKREKLREDIFNPESNQSYLAEIARLLLVMLKFEEGKESYDELRSEVFELIQTRASGKLSYFENLIQYFINTLDPIKDAEAFGEIEEFCLALDLLEKYEGDYGKMKTRFNAVAHRLLLALTERREVETPKYYEFEKVLLEKVLTYFEGGKLGSMGSVLDLLQKLLGRRDEGDDTLVGPLMEWLLAPYSSKAIGEARCASDILKLVLEHKRNDPELFKGIVDQMMAPMYDDARGGDPLEPDLALMLIGHIQVLYDVVRKEGKEVLDMSIAKEQFVSFSGCGVLQVECYGNDEDRQYSNDVDQEYDNAVNQETWVHVFSLFVDLFSAWIRDGIEGDDDDQAILESILMLDGVPNVYANTDAVKDLIEEFGHDESEHSWIRNILASREETEESGQ